jgi:hypothetical protein
LIDRLGFVDSLDLVFKQLGRWLVVAFSAATEQQECA